VVKRNERDDRRAIAEKMRKDQQRKERRRSLLILGGCVIVVLALLGSAVFVYVKDQRADRAREGKPLADLGVSTSSAGCDEVKKVDATGSGDHIDTGTAIPYPDAPPAFGPHWPNFLQGSEIRSFYTTQDRPDLERLVHSLEHGYTILWYDDTVKPGTEAYQTVQAIADKFDSYFIAAPWTQDDGKSFASGKHLALTHWTGPQKQQGVTQYCAAPSGAVVDAFTKDYVPDNAPEPGAA
jgi:hypothetical protein